MSVQVCLETVNSLSTPDCHIPENKATLKKKNVHKLRDGFNCQLTIYYYISSAVESTAVVQCSGVVAIICTLSRGGVVSYLRDISHE